MIMRVYRTRRATSMTNYKRRVSLLKGGFLRVVVRKTNRNIIMQIVEYKVDGDIILKGVNSSELIKYGWDPRCNIPTAYLTGLLLSKKFNDKDKELVLDTGLSNPIKGSIIFAGAKGCIDFGLKLKSNIEFDEERLSGKHISKFALLIKDDNTHYKNQFSKYKEVKFDPEKIDSKFVEIKDKIIKE